MQGLAKSPVLTLSQTRGHAALADRTRLPAAIGYRRLLMLGQNYLPPVRINRRTIPETRGEGFSAIVSRSVRFGQCEWQTILLILHAMHHLLTRTNQPKLRRIPEPPCDPMLPLPQTFFAAEMPWGSLPGVIDRHGDKISFSGRSGHGAGAIRAVHCDGR